MKQITYSRSFWAALLTFAGGGSVTLDAGRWCLRNGSQTRIVEPSAVSAVRVRPGLFWSTLELVAGGAILSFGGLARHAADHLHGVFTVAAIPPHVLEALSAWDAATKGRYVVESGNSGGFDPECLAGS